MCLFRGRVDGLELGGRGGILLLPSKIFCFWCCIEKSAWVIQNESYAGLAGVRKLLLAISRFLCLLRIIKIAKIIPNLESLKEK